MPHNKTEVHAKFISRTCIYQTGTNLEDIHISTVVGFILMTRHQIHGEAKVVMESPFSIATNTLCSCSIRPL